MLKSIILAALATVSIATGVSANTYDVTMHFYSHSISCAHVDNTSHENATGDQYNFFGSSYDSIDALRAAHPDLGRIMY